MLKANENPPIVWPETDSLCELTGPWWVAHTKSRNEKALAQDLISRAVSYFLPMHWKVKRKNGRTIRSLLPLFTGYMFFCGGRKERLQVLQTNRVANILEVKDQDKLIRQLQQIETALRAGSNLMPHKYIKSGRHCRVIAGPLAGLEGVVVRAASAVRLILQIDILGQARSVEIAQEMVEPVDE